MILPLIPGFFEFLWPQEGETGPFVCEESWPSLDTRSKRNILNDQYTNISHCDKEVDTIMPRAFTTEEKAKISASLISAGRTCFLKYGIRKTTIDDLVTQVGIAKGSFYQFFSSKENLYLELFMQEIPAMMTRLHDASFGSTDVTRDALVALMKGIAREIETNQLARIILDDPTEVERFLSTLEYETLVQQIAVAYAPMIESIQAAQARGEVIAGDPYQIAYCLGFTKFLAMYRTNMPAQLYESMIDFAPEVITDGLTCRERCIFPATQKTAAQKENQ
jgi:AcrR family transcriptional regulator